MCSGVRGIVPAVVVARGFGVEHGREPGACGPGSSRLERWGSREMSRGRLALKVPGVRADGGCLEVSSPRKERARRAVTAAVRVWGQERFRHGLIPSD
jgi:hypothetical protein